MPVMNLNSEQPEHHTLVLSPIVDGFRLTKVLMDDGSGLNLIYEETLRKMEIDWSRIERSSTTFRGIIPSREACCTGKITLDVVFGTRIITGPRRSRSKWPHSAADTMLYYGERHSQFFKPYPITGT